ncbi:MAG TPA: AI-2E family transporter, partial [Humisphaera sp.]
MSSKVQTALVVLVAIAVLYVAQAVFIPLALAALLAMLLGGPVQRLEKWRVPRVAAVTLSVVLASGLIVGIGYLVGVQIVNLANNLDQYQGEIRAKATAVRGSGGGFSQIQEKVNHVQEVIVADAPKPATRPATHPASQPATAPTSAPAAATQPSNVPLQALRALAPPNLLEGLGRSQPGDEANKVARVAAATQPVTAGVAVAPNGTEKAPFYTFSLPAPETNLSAMTRYLGLALGPLGTAGIVIVFVFFILLEREDLRDRVIRLVSNGNYTVTTTAVDDGLTR